MAPTTLQTKIEKITPAKAERILRKARNIRTLRGQWVAQLSRAMSEGRWELNGESIKLDADNHLVDGQHRLHAVIDSGKTISSVVTYNVASDVYVDIGGSRSAAQLMAADGAKNASLIAAVARLAWYYTECEFGLMGLNRPALNPDRGMIMATFMKYPEIAESVQACKKAGSSAVGGVAMLAFIHWAGTQVCDDRDVADLFAEGVISGDRLANTDGPFALRERILKDRAQQKQRPRMWTLYFYIRAWNAWVRGEKLQKLQIPRGLSASHFMVLGA